MGATECQWCHTALPPRSSGYHPLAPIAPPKDDPELFPWTGVALLLVLGLMLLVVLWVVFG
jgi:hypothetical protein